MEEYVIGGRTAWGSDLRRVRPEVVHSLRHNERQKLRILDRLPFETSPRVIDAALIVLLRLDTSNDRLCGRKLPKACPKIKLLHHTLDELHYLIRWPPRKQDE